jgi:integrase
MPKVIKPLTEMKIVKTKSGKKPFTLFDGGGLFLLIAPQGGKMWRFKYSFQGKQNILALGTYPEISLKQARERREVARSQVANNIDPGAVRKAQKHAKVEETETFEVIAREWHDRFISKWTESHANKTIRRLELDVFPWIGKRPIKDIEAPELLTVLRRIESRGVLDCAHRVRGICGLVFRYAVATGRTKRNPAQDLVGALTPAKVTHLAAITEPAKVGELLRAVEGYSGSYPVKCALKLAPLLFVRPGELRNMEWAEINFDESLWSIPAPKMKMKEPHLVPLSKQAVEILRELQPLTGKSKFVFPGGRSFDRAMSNNALLAALRRLGYTKEEMTPHGFRAMARTILDEVLQVRPELIEAQLAHAVRDPLGRAYNRTHHIIQRKQMMQTWSDYLDGLKAGAKVIPFKKMTG